MLHQIFAYAPVAARLLQTTCRSGPFGIVSAFAAAVAPCHRFVPDEDRADADLHRLTHLGAAGAEKKNVNLKEQYFDVIASKTENGIRRVPIADKILPMFKAWYK